MFFKKKPNKDVVQCLPSVTISVMNDNILMKVEWPEEGFNPEVFGKVINYVFTDKVKSGLVSRITEKSKEFKQEKIGEAITKSIQVQKENNKEVEDIDKPLIPANLVTRLQMKQYQDK